MRLHNNTVIRFYCNAVMQYYDVDFCFLSVGVDVSVFSGGRGGFGMVGGRR